MLFRSLGGTNTSARRILQDASTCDPTAIHYRYPLVETRLDAASAGVAVRFYAETGCGEPIPCIATTSISVRAGVRNRQTNPLYGTSGGGSERTRQESSMTANCGMRGMVSGVQYATLKVDVSATMNHTKRATILHSFIRTTFENAIGTVYMKIVAFSGGESELTLTSVSGCDEGFCVDLAVLQDIIDNLQASVDAWSAYDPGATAVYSAIETAVADLGVSSQAHADAQAQASGGAVGTVNHVIVFTDLDENARYTSLAETTGSLRLVKETVGTVSLVVFDPPSWMNAQDPTVMASIATARQQLEAEVDFMVHANELDELIQAFADLADLANRRANAWYELFVCPSMRAGSDHALHIEIDGYTGMLSGTFDATGFGTDGRTCPNADDVHQAEERSEEHTSELQSPI